MKKDILLEICNKKAEYVALRKQQVSESELLSKTKSSTPPRCFLSAISDKVRKKENALIAEIKKASPSKGLIRSNFDPISIAKDYEKAGATCISVLTDEPYFQGKDSYLEEVLAVTSLPVLRKDFMIDSYQILESRALGASCVLLIMAALSDSQALELESLAFDHGMDVLIEVHNKEEMDRALSILNSKLIGINNRNLKNMEISLSTTEKLAKYVPKDYTLICESGIYTNDDIKRINKTGVYSFLVGESLMRQDDISLAVDNLLKNNN